jgi:hypothetical protein
LGVIPASTKDLSIDVPITPGLNDFKAYAENSDNIKSLDASDGVVGDRSLAKPGTVYVLAVGVDDYAKGIPPLHYSANDARAFASAISTLEAGRTVKVAILTDAEATRSNIVCALGRLQSGAQNPPTCQLEQVNQFRPANIQDTVLLYFSGHGVSTKSSFEFLPHDTLYLGQKTAEVPRLEHTLSDRDLQREIEPILAAQLVLVLDACGSGRLVGPTGQAEADLNGFGRLARDKGMYILAAAAAEQVAMEGRSEGTCSSRSIMNCALLQEGILEKKVPAGFDGSLKVDDWFKYVVRRVPSLVDQQPVAFVPMQREDTQTGIIGYFGR